MFACEREGVSPDLLCLAKGITGGYLPLAATLASDEIYQAFLGEYQEFKAFFHGHTFTGNPLAAAVALASLEVFEKERVIENLAPKIETLEGRLYEMASHPHVGDIRQRGFMVGIELVADKTTREPFPVATRMGHRVILAARKLGAILRPLGDVHPHAPPVHHHRRARVSLPHRFRGYRAGHCLELTPMILPSGQSPARSFRAHWEVRPSLFS